MDSRLKDAMDLQSQLDAQRQPYLQMWQEISDRLLPDASNILRWYSPGSKRTQRMFDATAPLALMKYGTAMESMLTPRTERWHSLRHPIEELDEMPEVREYMDKLVDILFKVRYAPNANFAQQSNECYIMNGAYGNGPLFIDDSAGKGIRYRAVHISELFYAENFSGIVDLVNRKYKYTARQATQRFGEQNLPEAIRRLTYKDQLKEFTFLHCVAPNMDYKKGAMGDRGYQFTSLHICYDDPYICRAGFGYHTFPYAISRHITVPGDVYARGPASLILPDIKQVNEMEKTMLRQAQFAVDPMVLLPEDGLLSGFNAQPGAFVYGALNDKGDPMIRPYESGGQIQLGFEAQEAKRKVINDAFLVNLFQILVQNPEMTATEAMLRAQEKGQLLAPTMGRNQSEFLGNIIPRELEILDRAGELPPMPAVMMQNGGLVTEVEYMSPLNRAQHAEVGVAINQTLQMLAPLAQIDPNVIHLVKAIDTGRELARINGMPTKLLNTDQEMQPMIAASQQQATQQNVLAAAPVAAGAAKDMAQAQATAQQSPQGIAQIVAPRMAA